MEKDPAGDGRLTGPGTAFLPSKHLLLHLDVLSHDMGARMDLFGGSSVLRSNEQSES